MATRSTRSESFESGQIQTLIEIALNFGARGWTPATSGNYSVRLDDGSILMTRSGVDKRKLDRDSLMRLEANGRAVDNGRPSAEAGLHVQIYQQFPEINAVLHVHSPTATVVSRRHLRQASVRLENYELLKALEGIDTHAVGIELPVVENDQSIENLARAVQPWLAREHAPPGYLIAGHGIYAWGREVADAARHLEAFDFLLQCELMERS